MDANVTTNNNVSFLERTLKTIVTYSQDYQSYFVEYDYLLCSRAFQKNPYYIVQAHEDNYLHLTGVGTTLKANYFFEKCITGTLEEADINFTKKGNATEKQVKGTVRRKIKLLPALKGIFESGIAVEEDFNKNIVHCSFAVGNSILTLGFSMSAYSKPTSLMQGDLLDKSKSQPIDLVFRRKSGQGKFNEILVLNSQSLDRHFENIKELLGDELIAAIKQIHKQEL